MVITENFYIGYRDIDTNLKIKHSAILNIFEDIAGIHASQIGEGLNQADTTWLLTGYKVNIIKRPMYGEKVVVNTWGTEIKNITACREFEIKNENGELLVAGLSNWAHINLKTKSLEKVSPELIEAYALEPDKTNFNELKIKKITEPTEFICEKDFFIDWNWIDTNNHLNNIYYLDIADMSLPDDIMMNNDFTSFEISYKKEIKYKDNIKCYVSKVDSSYVIALKNTDSSETYAIVKFN